MPTAFNVLPARFADRRHEIIVTGLERLGYRIVQGNGTPRDERDLLVTWTVHRGAKEDMARRFEAAGGRVVVCEEAYLRRVKGETCFALALHDHNGAGRWFTGGAERWESFGIDPEPWRKSGDHILVREQRGIGSQAMASPPLWHDGVLARLKAQTGRPLVLRRHPKTDPGQPPLTLALAGAHALVTWASADAGQALLLGVPVFYEAPAIVCAPACKRGIAEIEAPSLGDRAPAFERLAWAQWSVSDIARGEPFHYLLGELAP